MAVTASLLDAVKRALGVLLSQAWISQPFASLLGGEPDSIELADEKT